MAPISALTLQIGSVVSAPACTSRKLSSSVHIRGQSLRSVPAIRSRGWRSLAIRAEDDSVVDSLRQSADKAVENVKKAGQDLGSQAENLKDKVTGQASSAERDLKATASKGSSKAESAGNDLQANLENAGDKLKKQFNNLTGQAEDAGDDLKRRADKGTSQAQGAGQDLQDNLKDLGNSAKKQFDDAVQKAKDSLGQ